MAIRPDLVVSDAHKAIFWADGKHGARSALADKSLDKIIYADTTEQQKRWDRQKLPSTHLNRFRKAA